jgi:hypothetical protein
MMLAISFNEIKFAARAASHMLLTADTFASGSEKDNPHDSINSPKYSMH